MVFDSGCSSFMGLIVIVQNCCMCCMFKPHSRMLGPAMGVLINKLSLDAFLYMCYCVLLQPVSVDSAFL